LSFLICRNFIEKTGLNFAFNFYFIHSGLMQSSNLYQLIQSFTVAEQKSALRFLQSPYFNQREDIGRLFELLSQHTITEKQQLWSEIYPDEPFDDTRFRLLMSYLNRLLERFLLVEQLGEKGLSSKLQLAAVYRNRGLMGHFERNMRAFEREISEQPQRNAQYHSLQRDYFLERHENTIKLNPTDLESLKILAHHSDVAYLTQRLRLICLELAQKNVYRSGEDNPLHRVVIELAEQREWVNLPAIETYRAACKMLQMPEESIYYQIFKEKFTVEEQVFSATEMREFYTFSINHCIRQTNRGERSLEHEVLELYQKALAAGYLFENGTLSRFTYHNIVAAALRCGELDWAEQFIPTYNPFLEDSYRDSSLSFNQARLDYARNRYDSVLLLLQKANYRDPLLNLAAKTLLLKTYFVLEEHDLLQSHLDAMRNYIHRKKVIGYHRNNYLNIIRFTERILQLEPNNKKALQELRAEIEKEAVLTEKEWFINAIN